MRQNAEVSRAASKNGVEQLGRCGLGDFFEIAVVIQHLERDNVVSEQTKTANELTPAACLDVAPETDIGTLSMWHEELVRREICIELSQIPADTGANKSCPFLIENGSVVGTFEGCFQVQLDVRSGRG